MHTCLHLNSLLLLSITKGTHVELLLTAGLVSSSSKLIKSDTGTTCKHVKINIYNYY